ncbi:MAG: excinuclease ABC subunit UvrB [bacterium]|nr:excinuclease ABC subunit UvrB [bacterium]
MPEKEYQFKIKSSFKPSGDQPKAIQQLIEGLRKGYRFQTLLGVTGSGKTFTMANVIEAVQRPVLVISHNKTLAAQLYREFKEFFPGNSVEYFVSYYDYYQPEAYVPAKDMYIEKDTSINEEIDKLRLRATSSLLERKDTIIVASVSCIYGLGSPEDYKHMLLNVRKGDIITRDAILEKLVLIQYERNDFDFSRGTFKVKGDSVDIYPSYSNEALRIEMFGDEIEKIYSINPVSGQILGSLIQCAVYPAKHFVTPVQKIEKAVERIKLELAEHHESLKKQEKLVEAQRILSRTNYDMEMLREIGYCNGIENYSRHIAGRSPGERPATLLDYYEGDFLTIIDESHVTVPQIRGMYNGDRARKETLVQYGFRLPSALDNRPLYFEEFEKMLHQTIFISATPSEFELTKSSRVVEQIIRPTGLVDPEVIMRPVADQVEDLVREIKKTIAQGERVLVTTLTKRMAEDLSNYLAGLEIKVRYLHSEIETIERVEILRDLRKGDFDVLVGINLLREGLDLPEVTLVAILDADKEGFLRSQTSLIQTMGRAARNIHGRVILYADQLTDSINYAVNESSRRRKIQTEYNKEHDITPRSIKKEIKDILERQEEEEISLDHLISEEETRLKKKKLSDDEYKKELISSLKKKMTGLAADLEFEKAAFLRDFIQQLGG